MQTEIISNKAFYEKTIENLKNSWSDKTHFVVDFDKTLTKAFIKWEDFPSLISILRKDSSILWEEYARKAQLLYNHYSKIERDLDLPLTEKIEEMSSWWRKHWELLVNSKIKKEHIEKAVNSGYLQFREWMEEFLWILYKNGIPLVIISANWLGWDSIKMFFEFNNLYTDNIFIISNEFEWDESWNAIWYKNKVIHSFNKSEAVIKDYPEILEKVHARTNVILMWDSLWDPNMIDWFEFENLLKIGFLNQNDEEMLKNYKSIYDVVLTWDANLEFVNNMLKEII